MQEIITTLQEKLHAQPAVSHALLNQHLAVLTRMPCAFELVLRSFPADSTRLSQFYARLLEVLGPECLSSLLLPGSMLAAHVRRELQKLMLSSSQGLLLLRYNLSAVPVLSLMLIAASFMALKLLLTPASVKLLHAFITGAARGY